MNDKTILGTLALMAAFLTACTSGCSRGPTHPETLSVKVAVTKNGDPLAGATVCFVNAQSPSSSGSGLSAQDGTVKITTFEHGDGLVPGSYKVTVRKTEIVTTPDPANPQGKPLREETIWHVPQKFSTVESTLLTAEVTRDGKNAFAFDVK